MPSWFFLAFVLVACTKPSVPTHIHTELSKNFSVQTTRTDSFISQNEVHSQVIVTVLSNTGRDTLLSTTFRSESLFSDAFVDCNAVRSYSTGHQQYKDAPDNDFGDIVVADLNFDGTDDIAIKRDSGGNSGPTYNYYLSKDGQLLFDEYLSHVMEFFPDEIAPSNRTLVTQVHLSALEESRMTYLLNEEGNTWERIDHSIVPY